MNSARTLTEHTLNPRTAGHPWSARADKLQSLTGLMLGGFLLLHMHFESSILLGKEVFYQVVQLLEGGMFSSTGHGFPWVTKAFSVLVLIVVCLHAALALRRFPTQLGQWRLLRSHLGSIAHKDTHAWFWQLVTGFVLFFLVPVHLFTMILNPEIGPHLSAERVFHDNAWVLYALLLPAVVVHAMIGLYRVSVKWGWVVRRRPLRKVVKLLIVYLLCLGTSSLVAYLLIGASLTLPVTPFSPAG
ncbi:fumarate reductase cytochrome b subunit [Shewanella litorisediminis]|uniref:Fumarate reductase cytochrome b subunit n=1 Tax=Shewanella litorisediminis TaxID=1173586 RepID=A0ABX7G288_9GAMM|nr:fumarate reductase cytochrome b subunit [Shewanella litorisediminis]MCL2918601.1 fumarate reductase cytochrome b subunit [Shewanella litorisediminis]QRH01426.1 fumarate reductase cytochrome b subunit [Shewanella litorisediminis]